ncbi:hypothetical protein HOLleu_22376 [Holothuria leucospilota]|uniref:Uncharacterized protein n=1 Tax=Holothuria leucospilota TaxID=206669 RepID=A0A9Q1H6Q5_HOLLE|nr:hypothetical protein HOLleu_22376 [Holothuria leucospilota]
MTDPIIHTPTDELDRDAQIAETRQEHEVTQDREQSVIPADGQTIEMTQAHRVQPDLEPLPTQEANIQQEETMPDLGVQPETEPVAIQANIHQEETMPDLGVQPRTEPSAIQENQRPRPISAITVTSPPQFRTPERGYDTVDSPEDATVVAMKELMLDFDSGPQITLLHLKDILPDGMEIRSLPDSRFEVIRKSEERHDVPLTCRKDGHHWDICSGDQFCFYISCGYCRKGCFFVGISGGECKQKGKEID